MSRGLSRTNKSREVFHQFADIVDFMSSNGLAREETSINLRPAPSSHVLEPKMGAETTFCKGGGVSDTKKVLPPEQQHFCRAHTHHFFVLLC